MRYVLAFEIDWSELMTEQKPVRVLWGLPSRKYFLY